MISLRNITKIYDKKTKKPCVALKKINLDIADRGMIFITGESGCGKSTLLNILGGLDIPTRGELFLNNFRIDTKSMASYRSSEVSIVFQRLNLIETLTVEENLNLVYEIENKTVNRQEIQTILAKVGLEDCLHRSVKEISGGEEQRLAIARAMLKNSKILLADEPTGNLDGVNSEKVLDLLKTLSQTMTVIVVSHESEYVDRYADRIITLQDGEIIADRIRNIGIDDYRESDGIGYIGKTISRDAIKRINRSACTQFIYADTQKYDENKGELKGIVPSVYGQIANSQIGAKTAFKLAFSKILKHKVRFIAVLIAAVLVFSLFGVSNILANYDIGTISANLIEKNGETALMFRKGMKWPPFGFTDRSGWVIDEQTKNEMIEVVGDEFDEYYTLLDTLYLTQNVDSNPYLINKFVGYIESGENRLSNYGFTIKAGKYPSNARVESNIEVALTDYTAYIISLCGALFAPNEIKIGMKAEELVGETICLGSESFYISGIIDTDFERFMPLIEGKDSSEQEKSVFMSKLKLYYAVLYFAKDGTENLFSKYVKYSGFAFMNATALGQAMDGATISGEVSNLKPPKITWSNRGSVIEDGDIVLTASMFRDVFGENFKVDQEYSIPFSFNSGSTTIHERQYRVAGVLSNVNLDYMPGKVTYVFSDKSFSEIANGAPMLTGLYTKLPTETQKVRDMINALVANDCYHESTYSDVVYEMYNAMQLYHNIFLYVSLLLLIVAGLLIFDFFRVNIKDKKRDIGILMALGLRARSASIIFALQIAVVSALLTVLIVCGIFVFGAVMGVLLNGMLTATLASAIVAEIPTVVYTATPFLLSVLILFITIAVATAYPIFKIIKSKPIDNIQM